MHLDSRLNWKHHVRHKQLQIKEEMRRLHWLVGIHYSKLDHANKRLLYVVIINRFGLTAYNCGFVPTNLTSKSFNVIKILPFCTIVAAYQFDRNYVVYRDLRISILDEIKIFANKHANRLEMHTNAAPKQLLGNSQDIRLKPYDLV